MCPTPYLAIAFSQSCEWDGLGFLSLGPRLPDSQEPRHLLAGRRKAIWESAVNRADRNLCPSGADIVRRDTQSRSKTCNMLDGDKWQGGEIKQARKG